MQKPYDTEDNKKLCSAKLCVFFNAGAGVDKNVS